MTSCKHNAFFDCLLSTALYSQCRYEGVKIGLLNMVTALDSSVKYVLISKDDFTSYFWVMPQASANRTVTTSLLWQSLAAFGSMYWLLSDQSSHFTSTVIDLVIQNVRVRNHLPTMY